MRYPLFWYTFRKLTGTTLKEDLNGFVKLVQELISDVAGVEAGLVGNNHHLSTF